MDFFIKYYLELGFDKIIILKSSENTHRSLDKRVSTHTVPNSGDRLLPQYDYLIKASGCDWVLTVDNDEFLVLGRRYKTIQEYVGHQLKVNKSINMFQFRWLMIEKLDNDVLSFAAIANTYNSYPNQHVKSMTKVPDIKSLRTSHWPDLNKQPVVFLENKCMDEIRGKHAVTRESYSGAALIHMHTRSIDDLILKALVTRFPGKNLTSISAFKEIISLPCNLKTFRSAVGAKARLPFIHTNNFSLNLANPVSMQHFNILELQEDFVKKDEADSILQRALSNNNIDYKQYRLYINELVKHINGNYDVKKQPAPDP